MRITCHCHLIYISFMFAWKMPELVGYFNTYSEQQASIWVSNWDRQSCSSNHVPCLCTLEVGYYHTLKQKTTNSEVRTGFFNIQWMTRDACIQTTKNTPFLRFHQCHDKQPHQLPRSSQWQCQEDPEKQWATVCSPPSISQYIRWNNRTILALHERLDILAHI